MRISIIIAITVFALLLGCDPDRGLRSRTAGQIAKLQADEQNHMIHPLADELFSHSKDERVVRNLTEISLTGDLTPYLDSSFCEFDQITKIDLYCTTNTDQFLALMQNFSNLTELHICETDATDLGVISVSKCSSLIGFSIVSWGDSLSMNSINELSNITTLQQVSLEISSQPNDLSKLREALADCKIYEGTYSNE